MRQQLRFNIGWLALQENAFPTTGRMTGKPEVIDHQKKRASIFSFAACRFGTRRSRVR
jgi:hypothetical protein